MVILIFISGRVSAISSAKQGKSCSTMYLLFGEESISCLGRANVRAFHENTQHSNLFTLKAHNHKMYVFVVH